MTSRRWLTRSDRNPLVETTSWSGNTASSAAPAPTHSPSDVIVIKPSTVIVLLAAVACLVVVASVVGQLAKYLPDAGSFAGLIRLFYLDAEHNIPTLFSVFLLSLAALLLTSIAWMERNRRTAEARYWVVLACGFWLMAVDESWSLHESLMAPMKALFPALPGGIFFFSWVIPGIVIVVIAALFFVRFLLTLPHETLVRFLVAGTLYVGGALGLELIEGIYAEVHGIERFRFSLLVTVEESLEMAGVIVLIDALLKYLARHVKQVQLRFE